MPDAITPEITALDQSEESAMGALYRAAVGEVNAATYGKIFAKYESADGAGPGWNWAAAFCTLNWMIFRRLWGAALAYTGAVVGGALLLFGIGRLVFQFSAEVERALLAGSVALAFIVPGVFGNAVFYSASRKRIEQALAAHTTLPEACAMLQRSAATRRRLLVLAVLNTALAATAIGTYSVVPSLDSLALIRTAEVSAAPAPAASSAAPANTASGRITSASASASAPVPVPAATSTPVSAHASAQAATTKLMEVSAPAAAASAPASSPASAPKPVASASAVTAPASTPAVAVAKPAAAVTAAVPKPAAPVPAVKPSAAAAKPGTAFSINVGLFADENNARNAYTKLIDAGLPAIKQEVRGPRGKFQRVRVGPFDSRAEADAAAEKIQALGLEAVVFQP